MQPFRYHVMICTQQKADNVQCCAASGAAATVGAFYAELGRQGLSDDVIVSTTGCLGACEDGPIVIVYPDAIWYGKVGAADVPEIVQSHLGQGIPVERLRLTDMAAVRQQVLEHRQKFDAMMRARDAAGVLPDDFIELTRAFQASRVVLTALELDLFTAVGGGARAGEVAATLRTNPRATEMLLNAVSALKLLEKTDCLYRNTPMTARFLVENSPGSVRTALLHMEHLWPRWSTLTECVREGTSVYPRSRNEQMTRSFIAAMEQNSKEGAAALARAVPGDGARRMLDLGGGSGAYSIALAKVNPSLEIEVLDLPSVLGLTQEYIRKAGLESRIRTRAVDLRTDALGQNCDLILVSSICHIFTPEQNRDLLRRSYEALAPKGRIIVRDFVLNADKISPRVAALFSLNMLVATDGGASYSEQEYQQWLGEAGFSAVHRVRLPGPIGLMVGRGNNGGLIRYAYGARTIPLRSPQPAEPAPIARE